MARTELTVEVANTAGLQPTQTALIADGHKVKLTRHLQIMIENGATALNLTLQTPYSADSLALPDKVIAIGANETHIINFRTVDLGLYVQSDGMVYLDYSDVTDGTVAVWI